MQNKTIKDFDEQLDHSKENSGEYMDYNNIDRVMIFIHGGLNGLRSNRKRSVATVKAIEKWNKEIIDNRKNNIEERRQTIYPILINWHSREMTWVDHMFKIRNGRFSWWAGPTFPITLLSDVGRTVGRLPSVYFAESMAMLSSITTIGRNVRIPPRTWPKENYSYKYDYKLDNPWTYYPLQLVPGVLRTVTIPLADFFLYESYQMMLRRIDMLFRTEDDYDRASNGSKVPENGAVSRLMHMLEKGKKKVILIGHSMGTIAVNEIVRRYPNVDFTEIIYMAAASTSKDFLDTIPPYLERKNTPEKNFKTKFYNLTLHPFADKDETFFHIFPNGSLLEWLDTYVLRVKTPLDLTFGKWNNAMGVLPLLEDLDESVKRRIYLKSFPAEKGVFSASGSQGKKGFPVKHSDFGRYPYWDPNFWDPEYKKKFDLYR